MPPGRDDLVGRRHTQERYGADLEREARQVRYLANAWGLYGMHGPML